MAIQIQCILGQWRREHPGSIQATRRGWLRQPAQAGCPVPRSGPRFGWQVTGQLLYPVFAWIAAAQHLRRLGLARQLFLDLGLDGRGVVAGAWP
jgi:hypothetical protein